jgi:hypothetical protein
MAKSEVYRAVGGELIYVGRTEGNAVRTVVGRGGELPGESIGGIVPPVPDGEEALVNTRTAIHCALTGGAVSFQFTIHRYPCIT